MWTFFFFYGKFREKWVKNMSVITDGYIDFKGYKTYYRIVGEKTDKAPLLALHGGPGSAHNYLRSLDDIAKTGRQVIYYDQIGCGKSKIPDGVMDWTEELFLEELDCVRTQLGLEKIHLLGQSWGGMLAMQYMEIKAADPEHGVLSFIIASSPASMKVWSDEGRRLLEFMPEHYREIIYKAEETGEYDNDDYAAANDAFSLRHVCSEAGQTDYVAKSFEEHNEVYAKMIGPSEFTIVGSLKNWDITADLHKINVPCLITSGDRDEATPLMMKNIQKEIPNCQWELLAGTHLVHVEQKDAYNAIVVDFIEKNER